MPFPPPGDLLDTVIEHMSLVSSALAGGFFTSAPPGKPFGEGGIHAIKHIYLQKVSASPEEQSSP